MRSVRSFASRRGRTMSMSVSLILTMAMATTVIVPVPVMGTVGGVCGCFARGVSTVAITPWAWRAQGACPAAVLAFSDSILEISGGFRGLCNDGWNDV